ncbi:hypothetical protein ACFL5O_05215 [Myxococcota bacterium]
MTSVTLPGWWARQRGRVLWTLGAAVLAVMLGVPRWMPTEEDRLIGMLEVLAEAMSFRASLSPGERRSQLGRALESAAEPGLVMVGPELSRAQSGREGVLEAVLAEFERYQRTSVRLGRVSFQFGHRGQTAVASLEATLTGERPSGKTIDTRSVVVYWGARHGAWRMTRVSVAGRDRAQPEARP